MTRQNNSRPPHWKFTGDVPVGDHPEVTKHLTESAVNKIAAVVLEVLMAVDVHGDMAPTTARLVRALCGRVAGNVMSLTRRWPK